MPLAPGISDFWYRDAVKVIRKHNWGVLGPSWPHGRVADSGAAETFRRDASILWRRRRWASARPRREAHAGRKRSQAHNIIQWD